MNGPDHYRDAEQLLTDAFSSKLTTYEGENPEADRLIAAAQVHATLALAAATVDRLADTYIGDGDHINQWRTATGIAPTAPQMETAPTVAYIYRAEWGMTPLGTYTTETAARTHCVADATNHAENPAGITFDWLGDESEPDSPYELAITQDGDEQPTDYTVTRIEVAAEYDPEADA